MREDRVGSLSWVNSCVACAVPSKVNPFKTTHAGRASALPGEVKASPFRHPERSASEVEGSGNTGDGSLCSP